MASRVLAADRGPRAIARLSRRAFVQRSAALGAAALLSTCGGNAIAPSPSTRVRRIGFLTTALQEPSQFNQPLRRELRELGYTEGRDLSIDLRRAEGIVDRLPQLAAELVALGVEVIVTSGGSRSALAAKQATTSVPIVFSGLDGPAELGLVADLARPGGNVTGVANPGPELAEKRLELLTETVPSLERVAVLFDSREPGALVVVRATEKAARRLGVDLRAVAVDGLDQLDAALQAAWGVRPQGLVDIHGGQFYGRDFAGLARLLAFVVEHRLPQIYNGAAFAGAGGLMGLGSNSDANWRAVARLVDRILKGTSPRDLPVEVNSVFDLALNLTMAQRIGLTFPDSVLRQATEVIQ